MAALTCRWPAVVFAADGCSDMTECVPSFNFAPEKTFTVRPSECSPCSRNRATPLSLACSLGTPAARCHLLSTGGSRLTLMENRLSLRAGTDGGAGREQGVPELVWREMVSSQTCTSHGRPSIRCSLSVVRARKVPFFSAAQATDRALNMTNDGAGCLCVSSPHTGTWEAFTTTASSTEGARPAPLRTALIT